VKRGLCRVFPRVVEVVTIVPITRFDALAVHDDNAGPGRTTTWRGTRHVLTHAKRHFLVTSEATRMLEETCLVCLTQAGSQAVGFGSHGTPLNETISDFYSLSGLGCKKMANLRAYLAMGKLAVECAGGNRTAWRSKSPFRVSKDVAIGI
jgi:hypothetical protein